MSGLLTASQITNITNTVSSSFDQSLPQYRNTGLGTSSDGYGHDTTTWTSKGNLACTVARPSASTMQAYAGIIGSRRALTMRAMSTSDVKQGDRITYDGLYWIVQERLNANSYSVTTSYLMTSVV